MPLYPTWEPLLGSSLLSNGLQQVGMCVQKVNAELQAEREREGEVPGAG